MRSLLAQAVPTPNPNTNPNPTPIPSPNQAIERRSFSGGPNPVSHMVYTLSVRVVDTETGEAVAGQTLNLDLTPTLTLSSPNPNPQPTNPNPLLPQP